MIHQPVHLLLRFLFISLLLVLAVAVGTEVAALHRKTRPAAGPAVTPVVVRKSTVMPMPHKTVHTVSHRAS
ncbi:hypothetical protein GCM10027594_10370 [Hymenobacter agri]